jgi:hypothetical protein
MKFYDAIRDLHVIAGAVALVLFWIVAALRKGSSGHIGIGRWYLIAMLVVMGTAVPLSIAAYLNGAPILGTFLAYLVLITGTACWTAWRAVRDKHDIARFVGPVFRALAWANMVAGLLVLALGLRIGNPVLIGVSLVGLISGPVMLRFARRQNHERRWWLAQHFGGMIGAGVATHVAFMGIGLVRLLPERYAATSQIMAWVLPISVSIVARIWLNQRYGLQTVRKQESLLASSVNVD